MSEPQDRWAAFVAELKRRRVFRVGIAYAGAAFVLLQVAQLLVEAQLLAEGIFQAMVVIGLAGLPLALLLGWVFDLTPDGLRVTGRSGQAGRLVARFRPAYVLGGGGVLLLALLTAVVLANTPREAVAEVAPGADLIAVLPFATSGEGVRELEQGMVDLLSRNLNEVGGIRTVDPRIVLSRWEQRGREGQLSFDAALGLALDARASSFLTGSVIAAGPAVRISADLYSVEGARLAGVQVDGPVQEVLGLVDSLSLALLREIWRSAQPIPRLNVSAITSGNLEAIRAYLAGERFYRASAWDSALVAFGRAVAADSLFALAHYRLATTASWVDAQEVGDRSAQTALRLIDRLPAREQTLVRAEALRRDQRLAEAIDTLSVYLEHYADDPEAWFMMADDLFHLRNEHAGLTDRETEATLWMFEQALTLDPQFTPALIHPLEVAFRGADTLLISRFLELTSRASGADTTTLRALRAAHAAILYPDSASLLRAALTRSLGLSVAGEHNLSRQAGSSTLDPLLRMAQGLSAAERAGLIAELRAQHDPRGAIATTGVLFRLLVMNGELSEAREVLATAGPQRGFARRHLRALATVPVLAGIADTTFFLASGELAPMPLARAGAAVLAAIDSGDAAELRRARRRLDAVEAEEPDMKEPITRAAAGFSLLLEGRTAEGLDLVEAALRDAGFAPRTVTEAFWMRWLTAAAAHPETRERALPVLETPWPGDPLYEVSRLYALGQALEAAGRTREARLAYARVVDAPADAGGTAPLQRQRARATAALARLDPSR